jgi:hypothetical protein
MKYGEVDFLEKAHDSLQRYLERITFISNLHWKKNYHLEKLEVDWLVTLMIADQSQQLLVEVKNSGQPRLAREAINHLLRLKEKSPKAYPVFMAPFISERSAEICIQESIGYADFAGNCRLEFDTVFIEQRSQINPFIQKRYLRSFYSPKAARILRVLLKDPKHAWKLKPLAQTARVSLGQVANVKKILLDREWLQTGDGGIRLREPEKLLKEWSEHYSFKKNIVQEYYSLSAIPEIEEKIAAYCHDHNVGYAFTGFSGAARLAPAVRYNRVMVFIDGDWSTIVRELNFKAVSSGANVMFLKPFDDAILYTSELIQDVRIAAPIQLYLDLVGFRGRGEEAAEALFNEVIKKTW